MGAVGRVLFGGGSKPQPTIIQQTPAAVPATPAAPVAPTREDPSVAEARARSLALERSRRGRAATIATGGQGVTTEAPVVRPSILGA